jgi:hypothetical protein
MWYIPLRLASWSRFPQSFRQQFVEQRNAPMAPSSVTMNTIANNTFETIAFFNET